jgi:hypothetical protein
MIKSKRMKWAVHVARTEKRNACRDLVGKSEEKRLLARRRWEDNIKMYFREIE